MEDLATLIALWEQSHVLRQSLRDGTFWDNAAWVGDLFDETPLADTTGTTIAADSCDEEGC
jgi:hypothetical protein